MKKKINLTKKGTVRQLLDVGDFYYDVVLTAYNYVQQCKRKGKKPYEEITDSMRFKWFLMDVLHETVVCNKPLEWGLKRFDMFMKTMQSNAMYEHVFYTQLALSTLQIQYDKLLLREGRAYHDEYDALETIDVTGFVFDEVSE